MTATTAIPQTGDIRPDRQGRLTVDSEGNSVVWQAFGTGDHTLLALHGGPGVTGYLGTLARLAGPDRTVVIYDQLGSGASDTPADPAAWTVDRCVDQVEAVREGLGLGRVDIYGHSWGGWLGQSYVLAHPEQVNALVLSGTSASIPEYLANIQALRVALGPVKHRVLLRAEQTRNFDDPDYVSVIRELNARHLRRAWPFTIEKSEREIDELLGSGVLTVGPAYERMWGPNEFLCTGPLLDWDVTDEIHRITAPTLIMCGLHDEVTVACSQTLADAIPDNEFVIFGNSSHMNMYEREANLYFAAIDDFLRRHAP